MSTVNYNQKSFSGGMNLLLDDSDLTENQYKVGFNLRNRYSRLDAIDKSAEDVSAPHGIKQEVVTFGNFIIMFVSGKAYYRYYSASSWSPIPAFLMNTTAPRFWTKTIPVNTTNYSRFAAPATINDINRFNTATSAYGNSPGLIVQDNITQPFFIFINSSGNPDARKTQTYDDWIVTYDLTVDSPTYGSIIGEDKREYIPIGNCMEFVDGNLYVVSPDKSIILRSVSGRPLDFVINVDVNGAKGGDAYTTAYSVGVPGISCIRALADGSLFVSASGANFSVSKDKSNVAVKEWGEFTYQKTPLFRAVCLSDRTIFDSIGDTRFISVSGIRSFNAVLQEQNEGRNSVFSSTINQAFVTPNTSLLQADGFAAAILFDDYELYSVNTIFGYAIGVYDTKLNCWASFDLTQTGGKAVKQFASIEISNVIRLYAITQDDKLYTLYSSSVKEKCILRTTGVSPDMIRAETYQVNSNVCGTELKPISIRAIFNNITEETTTSVSPYVNNYRVLPAAMVKTLSYEAPLYSDDLVTFPDTNTKLYNVLWSFQNCTQGWRCFFVITWDSGSLLKYSIEATTQTPMNPLKSQGTTK